MKEKQKKRAGLTRRGFISTMGISTVGLVASGRVSAWGGKEGVTTTEAGDMHRMELHVNGRPHRLLVEPRWSLLHVLREKIGLTSTKMGCDRGECGACTVLMDGVPRYSCLTLAVEAEGHEIITLEGLMDGERLGPVQQSFLEQDAYQCGYCTPGQIMAGEGLLRARPDPSLDEIQKGMSGNLCRCGAYRNIFEAVKSAAQKKKEM